MFLYLPLALISNDFTPRGITGKFVLHCTLRQTFDGIMLFWYGNFKVNSKRKSIRATKQEIGVLHFNYDKRLWNLIDYFGPFGLYYKVDYLQ